MIGHIDELRPSVPDLTQLQTLANRTADVWTDPTSTPDERHQAYKDWETATIPTRTWLSMAWIRFACDTQDEGTVKNRELADQLRPKVDTLLSELHTTLLTSGREAELSVLLSPTVLACWRSEKEAHSAAIEPKLELESKIDSEYTSLRSEGRVEVNGDTMNLSQALGLLSAGERETRIAAASAYWAWFDENRGTFDDIFDRLVALRTEIASDLGLASGTELGYRRMCRIDWTRDDVENLRREVIEEIVPLCSALRKRQAKTLGIDKVMYWDESVYDEGESPKPLGGMETMLSAGSQAFSELDSDVGACFERMRELGMFDLESRDAKAPGGFCASVAELDLPFVFANFNGSFGDVRVLIHEMGHAYNGWATRAHPYRATRHATAETCEVHAMGMEYLLWPHFEKFFDAPVRARQSHLTRAIHFLPYGTSVDYFQHLVYDDPTLTPDGRASAWQQVESELLPHRDYGHLVHPSSGRFWQSQLHIYGIPLYYIDYVLAQTTALQFWAWSQRDYTAALNGYLSFSKLGGSQPFSALVRGAGLRSPFERGSLRAVVDEAAKFLDV